MISTARLAQAWPRARLRAASAWTGAVVAGFVAAEIALLVAIPVFVTVDGATHVGGAALIRDVLDGTAGLHLSYVQLASFPAPNLLPEVALGIVMLVFDPQTAEKLLQVAYVVALPAAFLYALRGVRPGSGWLAALALPLTFSFAFQYGFYDFSLGVVFFLVAVGYAWRHRTAGGPRDAVVLGALALLVYLSHIVAYAELVLFLGTAAGWSLLLAHRRLGWPGVRRELRRVAPTVAGLAPSVALAAAFFLSTASGLPAHFHPFVPQFLGVLSLSLGLASLERLELGLSALLALSLLVLFVAALRRRTLTPFQADDALLAYAVVALGAALVAPSDVQSGGSFIPERLTLFPVYGLGLWLAASGLRAPVVRTALAEVTWVGIAALFLVVRLPTYLALSATDAAYVSVAQCMAENATMAQVNLSRIGAGSLARTDPFTEETGRLAAITHGHDLGNFEGSFPFFLFRNRPENDPFAFLATAPGGFEGVPPGVDLDGFVARTGDTVDYVIVVGRSRAAPEDIASADWTRLSAQLERGYRLVARSGDGLTEVYEDLRGPIATAGVTRRQFSATAVCVAP